ncbi:MAG: cation:proton antiporter [Myxococcales bacterium]|nr:cation:proton antiporter [Myxococcales bacterium]
MPAQPAFTLVLALAVGILAQALARHLRVPGIVLLLLAGVMLGPDGVGWITPHSLGDGLLAIVHLAVAVILFEGGLNLEISRLRRAQAPIRRLVTLGAAVTMLGAALAVHAVYAVSFLQALLFGSLVVVTGPTVIGPLVQELRLRQRVATVLEAEGVLIDPVGAIVAVLMLELTLAPGSASFSGEAVELLLRLGFGACAGILAGFAIAFLLRLRHVVPEGHENIFVLAMVLLLFQGCDEVVSESGILAVVVAGVVVGNLRTHVDRDLREFKDQLTILLIGLLFVLLAADVRVDDLRALSWRGLVVLGVLVFAVRPLGVWLCTLGSDLTRNERWFIAGVAPRGIVAAAVASVAAGVLEAEGIPGGAQLRALVFLTISGTVLLAVAAGPFARLLGVRLPGRTTVAILGAQGLGLALASVLRDAGRSVVFLDANPQSCRQAEEAGFPVVFGDALQERTQQRARFESVSAVVGLTPNQMLNSVFVSRTRERFRVPEGYIAVTSLESGLALDLVRREEARVLFEGPHDLERWDVRTRHGNVAIERWRRTGAASAQEKIEEPAVAGRETFVVLCVLRGARVIPMHAKLSLESGDVVAVAVHREEEAVAHEILRSRGFEPVPEAPEATQATAG